MSNLNVIEELEDKNKELIEDLRNTSQWGSEGKIARKQKIKIIRELINAYKQPPSNSLLDKDIEDIFGQQYGFEEQKRDSLEKIKIQRWMRRFGEQEEIGNKILCLVGPPGVGKTSFAKIIAKALNKKLFVVNLNSVFDPSYLTGSSNEVGQFTKALVANKSADSVILLDEIDKASTSIKNSLLSVLDREQNHNITDYYLDVRLDLSKMTFIATANKLKDGKDDPFSSRLETVNLIGYDDEQKKHIANKIIQDFFRKFKGCGIKPEDLEIPENVLEAIISKTNEKGVRQLQTALQRITSYFLGELIKQEEKKQVKSKIIITSEIVDKVIPQSFFDVPQEEEEENKKQREITRRLETKLKVAKLESLFALERNKDNFDPWEYEDYKKRINNASFSEDASVVGKEILLEAVNKKTKFREPPWDYKSDLAKTRINEFIFSDEVLTKLTKEIFKLNKNKNSDENQFYEWKKNLEQQLENRLIKKQLTILEKINASEMQRLKNEIENFKKKEKSDSEVKRVLFFVLIVNSCLIVGGVYKYFQILKSNKKEN